MSLSAATVAFAIQSVIRLGNAAKRAFEDGVIYAAIGVLTA